jgi:protein-tyrosine phosphatase
VDWLNLTDGGQDLSLPRPCRFSFEPAVDGEITVWGEGERFTLSAKAGEAELYNLRIGARYEWQVRAEGGVSAVGSFTTDPTAPRMLRVDGISNVRDFGGFSAEGGRVRQGMIYRTSEMDRHVAITEEGKRAMYEIGMKTDLDIRGAGEEPHAVLDVEKVAYVNIPLAAYDAVFTPEQMERYRQTYLLLTRPSVYPLFIHCWGGIDRTGTWLYILGALLGVPEEELGLDYEMSSFSRWGKRSRHSAQFRAFYDRFRALGDTLQAAAEEYLSRAGVSREDMETIREMLIEK